MCRFAPEKIYEVEGNWLTMQCAARCHEKVYPWADLSEKMAGAETEGENSFGIGSLLSGLRRAYAGSYGDGQEFYT